PGDRHQQTDQVAKPGLGLDPLVKAREARLRLAVDYSDRLVQRVVLPQMKLKEEAMMVGEAAVQRVVEFLRRGLQPSVGQGDELARIALARHHCLDYPPPVEAHDV